MNIITISVLANTTTKEQVNIVQEQVYNLRINITKQMLRPIWKKLQNLLKNYIRLLIKVNMLMERFSVKNISVLHKMICRFTFNENTTLSFCKSGQANSKIYIKDPKPKKLLK